MTVPTGMTSEHEASRPSGKRVAAAVVSFNRKDLLVECLDGVLRQTHPVERVLVVDNASTDGTQELLKERGLLTHPLVHYLRLPENIGGAGGFAEAVRLLREQDLEWLWLMDDDAEPYPDTLANLLSSPPAAEPAVVALGPKVVHADGTVDRDQRGDFRKRLRPLAEDEYRLGEWRPLGYISFCGSLVRASAARAVDLPRADFFIWGDDVEYSLRLAALGSLRLVPEAVMLHKRVTHTYMNRRATFWNRLLPGTMYPTPIERYSLSLCGLRNYLWMKRTYEGQGPLSAAGTTAQFMIKSLLYDEKPLRRMRWIVRYASDARNDRFVNIPPPRWVDMVRSGQV